MKYDFDEPVLRKGTSSVKWDGEAIRDTAGTEDAEPFWVADMDFRAAGPVIDRTLQAARQGVYGYPHFPEVRQVFCAWAKKRHGWTVNPDHVVVCQGMLSSIALLTELLTKPGDPVIVPLPAYRPFLTIVENLGRKLVGWPMVYDEISHRFSPDWEAFDDLCRTAKLLIFCSPHNPTGISFSEEELAHLSSAAAARNVTVVCDEIHSDLSFGIHHPLLPIATQNGCRAVTCMAPSKTFNIAGEHYSVAVIDDDGLRKALTQRMEQLCLSHTSYFSTIIANAAYEEGYDWLMQLIAYLGNSASFIETYLQRHIPELTFIKPSASFIGLIDCAPILGRAEKDAAEHPSLYDPAVSPNGGTLSRFFGIRAHIAVNDGTWFGGREYRQFVRFNYGTRRAAIEGALGRLERAVGKLKETYR